MSAQKYPIESKRFKPFLMAISISLFFLLLTGADKTKNKEGTQIKEANQIIIQRKVHLRNGAGTFFKVVETMQKGVKVSKIKEQKKWILVRTKKGKEGWIPKRALLGKKKKRDHFASLMKGKGVGKVSKTDIVAASKGLFDLEFKKANPKAKKVLAALIKPQFTPQEFLAFQKDRNKRATQKNNHKNDGKATNMAQKMAPFLPQPHEPANISEEMESAIGKALALRMIAQGVVNDAELTKKINLIGTLLATNSPRYDLEYRFCRAG